MVRAQVAALLVLVVGVHALVPAERAGAEPSVRYRPPVDAPVTDPFRPPPHRFGPGNRGLDYGTAAGTPVAASAPGRVIFAGPVGGTLHVTVLHDDGLKSSYSFLSSLSVVVGQVVAGGDQVGVAGGAIHFSIRLGAEYLDPALLLAGSVPTVHLVPVVPEPPGGWLATERAALWEIAVGAFGGAAAGGWGALRQAAAPWMHHVRSLYAPGRALSMVANVARRRLEQRDCTPEDRVVAPPPERRIVVLVAGLSSSSDSGSIDDLDTAALGYHPGDVVRFSYNGGQVDPGAAERPNWGSNIHGLSHSRYGAADTEADLRQTGSHLLDLLHEVAAAEPGVPIDVIAHSQGGVVTRVALAEASATSRVPAGLEHVVTLGSPHGGADLATAAAAIGADPRGGATLRAATRHLGLELDPTSTSVGQLAETSTLMSELAAVDVPAGVSVRSIASRGDLVVPVPRSRWAGATHAVVDVPGLDDHTGLPSSAVAQREVALALADAPPGCESLLDTIADQVGGELISWSEDLLGAGASGLLQVG